MDGVRLSRFGHPDRNGVRRGFPLAGHGRCGSFADTLIESHDRSEGVSLCYLASSARPDSQGLGAQAIDQKSGFIERAYGGGSKDRSAVSGFQ